MSANTCCFIGHRIIFEGEQFEAELFEIVEELILKKNVDTFLFGSKSHFNTITLKVVAKLKEKYPHIKRVYVRAEYPYIGESYKKYLLQNYEDTYYPSKIHSAGRAAYIERNYEMIDNSHFCIMYYAEQYISSNRKSGTKIAVEYAVKRGKEIINVSTL